MDIDAFPAVIAYRLRNSSILAAIFVFTFLGVSTQLEMLSSLNWLHALRFALGAFKLQHNFLRCLGLLFENRLRLPTKSSLFLIVTSLSLCTQGCFPSLVL